MYKVASILNNKGHYVHTVCPSVPLRDAVTTMRDCHIAALVVAEEDRAVGILTERDVLLNALCPRADLEALTVGDVMEPKIVTVPWDTSVEESMQIMTQTRRRHILVREQDGILGLISIGDVMKWLVRDREERIGDLERYITSG